MYVLVICMLINNIDCAEYNAKKVMGILHLSSQELRSERFQETRTIILPHPSTKKRNPSLKIIKQIPTNENG
jgi:hypothetical protein